MSDTESAPSQVPRLFFRLVYSVRDLIIRAETSHRFDYEGPHELKVLIRAPSADEIASGRQSSSAVCTASSRRDPNVQNYEIFQRIAANQIMSADDDGTQVSIDYPGPNQGTRIRIPALSKFPQHFQSFIQDVRGELRDYAQRTVSVLRWRSGKLGPHNPFASRGGMEWSVDGEFWHSAPGGFTIRGEYVGELRVSPSICEEVRQIVAAGDSGPLHRDLFREAWGQRHSSPRSALVIGMASAELAVKTCISTLVPEAEWLAMNLPTPPLIQMLVEYLPRLPARDRINGAVKPPPKNVLDVLRKGVTIRNQLSHAGKNPAEDDVEKILEAVDDLLWLLDYYSGHEWALQYLRDDTRSQLSSA